MKKRRKKMPNWCNNTLELKHANPEMIKRAKDAFEAGRLLDEFIPIPLELKEGAMNIDELQKIRNWEYKKELDAVREKLNIKYFGFKDWYDFCVSEWGTKWDIGGDDGIATLKEDTLILSFDSAYSPPIDAYKKLEQMGFEIWALYYESGMMFCGSYGQGNDEFYDIDAGSEWVEENIPKYINEEFGISQSMAEWEDDNQEEEEDVSN
jgi:hypothetical protein